MILVFSILFLQKNQCREAITDERDHTTINELELIARNMRLNLNLSENKDEHKSLFPIEPMEWFATALLAGFLMVSNAAGIGGGAIIVPILLLFKFEINVAVALTNVVTLVSSATRCALEFNERHPLKKAIIIDNNIVVLMLPCIMIGSFLGVQLNVIAPPIVIMLVLMTVLVIVSYKTTLKSIKLYKEESEQLMLRHEPSPINSEHSIDSEADVKLIELQDLHYDNSWEEGKKMKEDLDPEKVKLLEKIQESELTHFHMPQFSLILASLAILIIVS